MTVRSTIGPLTHTTFNNDLNVISPYTINIMIGGTTLLMSVLMVVCGVFAHSLMRKHKLEPMYPVENKTD